jgi:hypothetical protein
MLLSFYIMVYLPILFIYRGIYGLTRLRGYFVSGERDNFNEESK